LSRIEPCAGPQPLRRDELAYVEAEAVTLLRQVSAGEHTAFERLYRMVSGRVAAYLLRLTPGNSDVEDVLIDTFVEVWRKPDAYRGCSTVSSWIIGIARNLAMNALRRRRHHGSLEKEAMMLAQESTNEDMARTRFVRAALRALPQQHREILALALMRDFSYEQIAFVISIPVNTVKTRVFYAKTALRAQLQAMGIARDDVV
jgi:RNA polymerase sigma-70 factor (ECF subfamily)